MSHDLAAETAVVRDAEQPSLYRSRITDDWSYLSPSGGVLMTVALRAIAAEIGDDSYQPLSATALFCAVVPSGALRTQVTLLRRGKAAIQARAALSHEGAAELGLEVVATFARSREVFDVMGATMPDVPLPAEAHEFREQSRRPGGGGYPFFDGVEMRLARGERWWEPGFVGGEARFARWMRYIVPQRTASGRLDPLALPPLADTMPPALVQKLGPTAPWFVAPSFDLTVHFLDPTERDYLLVSAYCRRARAGSATAEVEIWDDEGRLVAFATQTMMLRVPRIG